MSPLLRALAYSRTAHAPVTQAMLLQCYTALDAFRRHYGSRELFSTLGRYLLVAEELCRAGLEEHNAECVEAAQAAMVELDAHERQHGAWLLNDDDYALLCAALSILDEQLGAASLDDIAKAESRMVTGLLRAHRQPAAVSA